MALAAKLDEQILNRATVGLLTFGTAPTVNGAIGKQPCPCTRGALRQRRRHLRADCIGSQVVVG